jgi:predicted small secreted protein
MSAGSTSGFIPSTKGSTMRTFIAMFLAASLTLIAGCNTIEGAGKDVKAVGQGVENAADSAKPK